MLEFATSVTDPAEAGSYDGRSARNHEAAISRQALDPVFPLLLAIADDERAAAAIRATSALARGRGAVPTVLRALGAHPDPGVTNPLRMGLVGEDLPGPEYRDEQRAWLQRLVAEVAGEVQWRIEASHQSPIDAIVEQTRQIGAELIVMGLRRRGARHREAPGRAIVRDLLDAVVRSTRLPILAVTPSLRELPERIVVGVDFSEASIRAAALARHILAPDGEMYLIHVATNHHDGRDRSIGPIHRRGANWVRQELDDLIQSLSPTSRMRLAPVVADGDVTLSIDGCARRVNADLVAVGSDPRAQVGQFGSASISSLSGVPMALAHKARWSMLMVPAREDV